MRKLIPFVFVMCAGVVACSDSPDKTVTCNARSSKVETVTTVTNKTRAESNLVTTEDVHVCSQGGVSVKVVFVEKRMDASNLDEALGAKPAAAVKQ